MAPGLSFRVKALVLFGLAVLSVLLTKGLYEGWFAPRQPLELSNQPALLFFNRYKGCECALVVYEAAQAQIESWPEESRGGIRVMTINLDHRPDLGKQYGLIRAPALILVDANGNLMVEQNEIITDTAPLDLTLFEQAIKEFQNGT